MKKCVLRCNKAKKLYDEEIRRWVLCPECNPLRRVLRKRRKVVPVRSPFERYEVRSLSPWEAYELKHPGRLRRFADRLGRGDPAAWTAVRKADPVR